MNDRRYNHHIHGWLEKIEANIAEFEALESTNAEKLEFISHQYHLVMLIRRVLEGNAIFVGAKPIQPAVADTTGIE
jgi:plasmid rolling circle replication initiator protein Rep